MSIIAIIEKKPRTGFHMLAQERKGLCITRFHPNYLKARYSMEGVEIYWLSEIDWERGVKPDKIERIVSIISNYTKANQGAKVLFDGAEYLLLYNSTNRIAKMLNKIEKLSEKNGFTLLIHLDPEIICAGQGLYEIFAQYFSPQQEEELRQTFQGEPVPGVQTAGER